MVCVSVVNKNARWTQDQHSCSIWRDAVILRGPRLNEALAQPGRGLSAAALFYIILPQGNNQTGLYSAGFNLIATAPAFAYKLVGSGVVYSLTLEKWPIEKPPTHITHTTGRLSYILAASGRPRKVGSSQRVSHESFVVDIYDDRCSFEFFTGWGTATSRPVHHRGCLLHYFLLPSLSNSLFLKHVVIVRELGCCCQLVGIHFPNKVLDFCLFFLFLSVSVV